MKNFAYCAVLTFLSWNCIADNVDLQDIKKGSTSEVYVGSTSGLVRDSVDSVNRLSNQQYKDSQRYSSSGNTTGYEDSSKPTKRSNKTSASSPSASANRVKEIYDGGYKSSKGYIIYRVVCKSGRDASAYQDSAGRWKDGSGSNYGSGYRNLSLQNFGEKYCQ